MADISKLSRLIAGVHRNVDLTANTLVVQNLKVNLGGANQFTFAGTLTGARSINVPDADVNLGHIASLVSLSGVAGGSTDLGTFTGVTIPDASTIKGALQSLETAIENGANAVFSDDVFRITDNADGTKRIAFEASAISTATTRTITMPDANVSLADVNNAVLVDGSRAFTADQSFGGFKATNLADPVAGQDAVTLTYLNARIAGIKPKAAVRAATVASGTLASSFEAGDIIDGVTLVAGDRILIKDQSTASENGIYTVNATGAPTRATDFDSVTPIDEINGAWVSVQEGTANAGRIYVQFGTVTTIGVDSIDFIYFNPIAGLIGGDMITFAGSTFSVDLAAVSGLESTNPGNVAGQLRIKLEASNPSLQINGSNELGAKLDATGAILSGASGLAVQVDDSTIERASNALRVKDAGITAAKLNSNVADQITITGGAGTALAVAQAPKIAESMVAGESFAANTSFLVRMARNGETAGRVYKADNDASTNVNYQVIGIALSTSAVSAGGSILVIKLGQHALGSSDTAFASADLGLPVFLTTAGAFSVSAPTADNTAVTVIGMVRTTTSIEVQPQFRGIN